MNEGIFPRSANPLLYSAKSPVWIRFANSGPPGFDICLLFLQVDSTGIQCGVVYDSSTGGLRTGECSRFMHQLHYESPVKVKEINPFLSRLPVKPILVEKTGDVADLHGYSGSGEKILSPSALNEFLNCSLRFYFHHIAGLPQPEEVTEDIDARIFGNLLHKAMQILYGDLGCPNNQRTTGITG